MSLPREELEKGRAQLERLVSNHFFRSEPARDLPAFAASEVGVGPRLGVGGFGVVCEVQRIRLDEGRGREGTGAAASSTGIDADADVDALVFDTERDLQSPVDSKTGTFMVDQHQHDHHYNMTPSAARAFMTEHSLRNGDARYAIKRLKSGLSDKEKVCGAKDLAIEAKFLAVISHPNIIKMRGTAATDSLRYDFFILMDRLYGTLDEKIEVWAEQEKQFAGFCCGICGADREGLECLLLERITALYDASKALAYLHENNIIYRDVKPENLGFDVR